MPELGRKGFGLLSILSVRPRMLSDLASLQGVSLPTMSNSISAMVERGWVRREAPEGDRRVVMIDVTPGGRAALERVTRCAEAHLADVPDQDRRRVGGRRRQRAGAGVDGVAEDVVVIDDDVTEQVPQVTWTATE